MNNIIIVYPDYLNGSYLDLAFLSIRNKINATFLQPLPRREDIDEKMEISNKRSGLFLKFITKRSG